MRRADFVGGEDGRLSAALAATLVPKLQDALDHPVRRELLRTLNQSERSRSVPEISAQLPFRLAQLSYHLQVLRRAGAVASEPIDPLTRRARPRYASEVAGNSQVWSVLRATERWDRERREMEASAGSSSLLTMFRRPRPVRTIRLRGRRQADGERSSE